MRAIALAMLAAVCSGSEHRIDSLTDTRDSWTTNDKAEHAVVGFAIGYIANTVLSETHLKPWKRRLLAFGAAVVAGTAKEISDYQHPRTHDCSEKDAVCTYAGGALGVVSAEFVWRF